MEMTSWTDNPAQKPAGEMGIILGLCALYTLLVQKSMIFLQIHGLFLIRT